MREPRIYGYCRVSTKQQSIDRQIRNIKKEFPEAVIMQEAYTGTKIERPVFDRLLKELRSGDTVVFDSVSRMSRNAEDGYELYQKLDSQNVRLIFLKQHHIDTDVFRESMQRSIPKFETNTANKSENTLVNAIISALNDYQHDLVKEQIRLAFQQSQQEVDDLRQRTKEGIETARIHGKQIGQKPGIKITTKKEVAAKKIIQKHAKDFGGTLLDREVMQLAGVSHNTYYKYKRQMKD
ncbi:site-specific recombinase [Clostridium sp. SY8519]|uniref:recombinase family protein n=1 Tax=Clostridium sp. (strain SY8519) TaxID=1042156 RepID=UPI000217202B|nr:recombinase family protein [Clostridium sp. SY8519]BAK46750.1 site-specific recombinase [Clostridium sp. SY8519]